MVKLCESCHELRQAKQIKPCPICGRGTCSDCRCPGYTEGHKETTYTAFLMCQLCAEQTIAHGQ